METQGKLKQLRDAVKQRWGALTDKDLDTVDEKLGQLPGLLQARYGYTGEQAEKKIALFLDSMKPEGKRPSCAVSKISKYLACSVLTWYSNGLFKKQLRGERPDRVQKQRSA